jgi:hypothetical protein
MVDITTLLIIAAKNVNAHMFIKMNFIRDPNHNKSNNDNRNKGRPN